MTGLALLLTGLLQVEQSGTGEVFEPFLPGMILILPLAGFVANGVLALVGGCRSARMIRTGTAPESGSVTHSLPSWIGPGAVGAAFLLTAVNFVRMLGAQPDEPFVQGYWTWIASGNLSVEAAIQLDQLSLIMMMVITTGF